MSCSRSFLLKNQNPVFSSRCQIPGFSFSDGNKFQAFASQKSSLRLFLFKSQVPGCWQVLVFFFSDFNEFQTFPQKSDSARFLLLRFLRCQVSGFCFSNFDSSVHFVLRFSQVPGIFFCQKCQKVPTSGNTIDHTLPLSKYVCVGP